MKKLLLLSIIILLLLSGCSKKSQVETVDNTDNYLDDINKSIEVVLNKYGTERYEWSDNILAEILSRSKIKSGTELTFTINAITNGTVVDLINSDSYFKSELIDSMAEGGNTVQVLAEYVKSIYTTDVKKENISYKFTLEDLKNNNLGFVVELYNMYCVDIVNSSLNSIAIGLKLDEMESLNKVTTGTSITLGYYGEGSICVTIDNILSGKEALEYIKKLSSTNSVQTVNPNTEIKIVEYTVDNLIDSPILFKTPIVLATKELQIYKRNQVFSGEILEEEIKPYGTKSFKSVLIGEVNNSNIFWYDTLTKETFIIE